MKKRSCNFYSALAEPVVYAVRRKLAAAAEVVPLAGEQVHGAAAAGVEVGCVWRGIGVDGAEHPLTAAARHFHLGENRARALDAQALDDLRLELPWWD